MDLEMGSTRRKPFPSPLPCYWLAWLISGAADESTSTPRPLRDFLSLMMGVWAEAPAEQQDRYEQAINTLLKVGALQ